MGMYVRGSCPPPQVCRPVGRGEEKTASHNGGGTLFAK